MKFWYECSEAEKVSNYYSKYSISTFWDWWSNKESKVMEVRIQDYELIKIVANKFNLQWSSSGVYVQNANDLKQVIGFVRDKATVWFGIQPRKKNWNKWGSKGYNSGPRGGSSDVNIDELAFVMIDIDRRIKKGCATSNDLKQANKLADEILERLGKENWNKGYVKIVSGHGLQLIIKNSVTMFI